MPGHTVPSWQYLLRCFLLQSISVSTGDVPAWLQVNLQLKKKKKNIACRVCTPMLHIQAQPGGCSSVLPICSGHQGRNMSKQNTCSRVFCLGFWLVFSPFDSPVLIWISTASCWNASSACLRYSHRSQQHLARIRTGSFSIALPEGNDIQVVPLY